MGQTQPHFICLIYPTATNMIDIHSGGPRRIVECYHIAAFPFDLGEVYAP